MEDSICGRDGRGCRCTMYDVQCTVYSAVVACEGVSFLRGCKWDGELRTYVCVCAHKSLSCGSGQCWRRGLGKLDR
jgi:hypothetical protein